MGMAVAAITEILTDFVSRVLASATERLSYLEADVVALEIASPSSRCRRERDR